MKLWRSPVFYFGIALVLAVAAAFLAPYVIDWGSYRMAIESYGSKMAGRPVTVKGDISGRFFPWPKLTIRDVKIANPPGSFEPDFVSAEEVDVRMTLAGLLGGEIRVEGIDIVRPVVAFERLDSGQGSWHLTSQASPGEMRFLDRIRLDQITVTDGVVHLIDNRRAGRATVTQVNATLAAQNFAGPWRVRGVASYRDRPVEIAINTGGWSAEAPFKFGFRIASVDGSGLVYQFDGANDGNHVTGNLKIQPAASSDGRSDPEGQLRPLVLTAQVTSDFDTVALDKIEIAPRDATNGGANLLTGSAEVKLGASVGLKADLKATRFDLDAVAGAKAKSLLREGGGLALLENALAIVPEDVAVNASLGVTSLIVGGAALDNARVAVEVNSEAIRIKEISAGMPGQARGLFSGVFLMTESGPQLAGDLAGEAGDLREFISWAWPEGRDDIARIWTGSRGRFKVQTRLDATSEQLRLQEMNYQIDESLGSGGLAIAFGARPALDMRLDASALDIDRYVPNGMGGGSWLGTVGLFAEWAKGNDLRVTLQSGKTLLNGVDARDVAIDIAAIDGSIDLKTVEIGNVGDARLEIAGLLSPTATGSKGTVSTSIKADDPRSLLQLLGVYPKDGTPVWSDALGKTDLTLIADLKPDDEGQAANFRLTGKTGDLEVEADLASAGQAGDLMTSEVSGELTLRSATGAGLLRLIGMRPASDASGAARLTASLTGSLANGLVADLETDVFGAKGQFQGKFLRSDGIITGTGRAGIFTERPGDLFLAAGIAGYTGGALSVESDVEIALPKVTFPNVQGFAAGAPLSGAISFESGNRVKGEFSTGPVSLSRIFGLVFMPWDARAGDLELPFAATTPRGLLGELWIKPEYLEVFDGMRVKETQIGISANAEEVRLAAFGKSDLGGDVAIEVAARPQGGGKALDGRLVLPVDLGRSLKDVKGSKVASGLAKFSITASGAGRTPGAVLASLKGSGSYDVANLALININAERFVDLVKTATTGEAIKAAFAALSADGLLSLGSAAGVLKIEEGAVSMPAFVHDSAVAHVNLEPKIDLADARLDAVLGVKLKTLEDEAQFGVTYSGRPDTLTRFVDVAALESKLGFRVVERTLRELEKLQAEQQKLMEEEDRQRREDDARLQAYNDQRNELQRRLREVDVHRRVREEQAVVAKAALDQAIAEGRAINRAELMRKLRERQVHRMIRRQEELAREAKAEAERKAQAEAARQAKEQAERQAQEEAARRAQEEADRQARAEEAARQAQEEAERKAQAEAALRAQEEADRQAREEAARQAQAEAERKAHEEAARQAQEEADRKAREEAARQAQEEAERKAQEEAARRVQEEVDRIAREEAARQAQAEAERKAREEAARQAQEEADRIAREEAARQAQEEADRIAREEAARQAQEEADRIAREEATRQAQEEADRIAREEAARQAQEEADRKAREEVARQAQEEADRKSREEAALQAQREADRKLREDAERQAREQQEADRKALEDLARQVEEEARAASADPAQAKQLGPMPDTGTPLSPPDGDGARIFGPPPPSDQGASGIKPESPDGQTGALEDQTSSVNAVVIKPPAPKPKPKRAKTEAKAEPTVPLVLVPPQKIAKPKREPNFFERLFGRRKTKD